MADFGEIQQSKRKETHPYSRHPTTIAVDTLTCAQSDDCGVCDEYAEGQRWEETQKAVRKWCVVIVGLQLSILSWLPGTGFLTVFWEPTFITCISIINTVCVHHRDLEVTEV